MFTLYYPMQRILYLLHARKRVYPEFCVNVLRECKQQKLV